MGLRGPGVHAQARRAIARKAKRKRFPWDKRGLGRVERVIAFLEFLPITKGRLLGQKMTLLDEQRRFVEDVYSRGDDDRVRIAILSEPRGNGKTGLIAGLALCHLLGPEAEPRGEVYSAAIDRQQAGLIADEMEAVINTVPEFAARINSRRWPFRAIEVLSGDGVGSKYEALSADARRGHGLAPSFWAYDELAQAKDRELFDALQTAMGKRKRALGVVLSTQAANDEHPLSQIIDDAKKGEDPSILLHLLTAPTNVDPFDPDVIRSVNPAFGKFLDEADVLAEAARARRMPSFETAFRNLRLNQRVAPYGRDQFLTSEVWEACSGPVDESIFTDGRPVFSGLDLSTAIDLSAFVLAAEDDGGNVHLKAIGWTPADTVAERMIKDRAPYDAWIRSGYLVAAPGSTVNFDWIAFELGEIVKTMNLVRVNFDPWQFGLFQQALDRVRVVLPIEPLKQTMSGLSPCVKAFEVLAIENRLRHGGNPLLRWCITNAVVYQDARGNKALDKAKSYGRIDLAAAAVMAVGAMKASEEPPLDVSAMIA